MKINGNIVEKTPVNANQRFALIDKSLSPCKNNNRYRYYEKKGNKLDIQNS